MKLTKAAVERAWKARGATRQILRDEQTRGLALVVNATSASLDVLRTSRAAPTSTAGAGRAAT